MPTQAGLACNSAITSGATTAGNVLPTEAKVCCANIATRAVNIKDTAGGPFLDAHPLHGSKASLYIHKTRLPRICSGGPFDLSNNSWMAGPSPAKADQEGTS